MLPADRAVQVRALQLISFNMPFFTRHLVKGGPDFWQHLREGILDLVPRVSREEFVHSVAAHDKVLVELIAADRRDAAVAYIENWGSDTRRYRTFATPEGMRVELPLTEGLPDDVTLMSDRQLEFLSRVMRVVWDGDELTVSGWAFIRNVDLTEQPARRVGWSWSPPTERPGSRWPPRRSPSPGSTPWAATGTATTATAGSARGSRPGRCRPTPTRNGRSS